MSGGGCKGGTRGYTGEGVTAEEQPREARVMEGDDAWKERGGRGRLLERRLEIKPLTTLEPLASGLFYCIG